MTLCSLQCSKGKKKVSHVFMSLCRHAFQVQGRITTWSWTCRFATRIIVSPPTGRNRSEVWLLPERKQSCSQKSFLFFISLLFSPHPTSSFCHTLEQRQPSWCLNCRKFSRAAWKAEHAKSTAPSSEHCSFSLCKAQIWSFWELYFQWEDRKKKINPTRPILGIVWVNWFM